MYEGWGGSALWYGFGMDVGNGHLVSFLGFVDNDHGASDGSESRCRIVRLLSTIVVTVQSDFPFAVLQRSLQFLLRDGHHDGADDMVRG